MRHLALVLLVAAACGGGAKPTTATTTAPVAAETPMPEYCQEYEASRLDGDAQGQSGI